MPPREARAAMSVLSHEARVRVAEHLVEGSSIASTVRLTDVSKPTVLALLLRLGTGCGYLHNRLVRGLECAHIELDEMWSYIHKKQRRVKETDPQEWGDAYTYVAITTASRLVVAYHVGKRDEENTKAFIVDLRARLVTIPQLSTDGWPSYPIAIGASFGENGVDYAMVIKDFKRKAVLDDEVRYEPPRCPKVTKHRIFGEPDIKRATTSHAEAQNRTMRMHIRRLTRLVNGFSRKLVNHRAAVQLHFAWYNLVRIHESLRVTPAMEAGITNHVWSVSELVEAALAAEPVGPPVREPLALPVAVPGEVAPTARELPNGRGHLRVIQGGQAPPRGLRAAPRQLDLFPGLPDPPKKK